METACMNHDVMALSTVGSPMSKFSHQSIRMLPLVNSVASHLNLYCIWIRLYKLQVNPLPACMHLKSHAQHQEEIEEKSTNEQSRRTIAGNALERGTHQ